MSIHGLLSSYGFPKFVRKKRVLAQYLALYNADISSTHKDFVFLSHEKPYEKLVYVQYSFNSYQLLLITPYDAADIAQKNLKRRFNHHNGKLILITLSSVCWCARSSSIVWTTERYTWIAMSFKLHAD